MMGIRPSLRLALLVGTATAFIPQRPTTGADADICQAAGCGGGSLLCGTVRTTSSRLVLVPYLWVYVPVTEETVIPCFERHDEM
jgi:hypothetical protein